MTTSTSKDPTHPANSKLARASRLVFKLLLFDVTVSAAVLTIAVLKTVIH